MIRGDGMEPPDSNVALVSDGEYIVNARAASKNRALLAAVNSGKAPKFSDHRKRGSDLEHPRADRQRPCRRWFSRAAAGAAHRRPCRRHLE